MKVDRFPYKMVIENEQEEHSLKCILEIAIEDDVLEPEDTDFAIDLLEKLEAK